MLRVAVIADIHGNVPALDAVIDDIERQNLSCVYVAGDLVGRGPQGRRVVERIRLMGWTTIRGNHEDYLLGFRQRRVPESWWHTPQWAASRWMAAELDPDAEAFIDALPLSVDPHESETLTIVHGSTRSHSEGLGPWTPDETLVEHLAAIDRPVLVCAHTHRPMIRSLAEGTVVNVGSVGLPFNEDTRAQYVVFHEQHGTIEAEFRQVAYDRDAILDIYASSGFLREGGPTAAMLRLELLYATPYLVPFLAWCDVHASEPTMEAAATYAHDVRGVPADDD